MMIFARSKMVVFFLLFANIITPMMRLPDFRGVFYDRSEQNPFESILTVENYMSLGTLAFQAASLVWLKKQHALFGTELIPKTVNVAEVFPPIISKHLISTGAIFGLIITAMSSSINATPQVCIYSGVNAGINMLLLTSSMSHISNLIYNDALKGVKKKIREVSPPELILKQTLDTSTLPDNTQCLMCLDDSCTCGYVNLCNNQEHVFCKECVVTWFNEVRKRSNFANKYQCELCRTEVPRNDEKFEITLPPEPQVTLGAWFRQMVPLAIFYCIGLYVFVNLVQCQLS